MKSKNVIFTIRVDVQLYMHVLTDSAIYSLELFNTVAIPKSPSLTNPVLVKKMFSVLMSLKREDKNNVMPGSKMKCTEDNNVNKNMQYL